MASRYSGLGIPMFLPALSFGGALFLAGALLASITILFLLDGWASAQQMRRNGLVIRLLSASYWLAAVPVMVGIVILAFALVLPLMFAALTGGGWLGAVPGL